ncbi:hypothetical protein D4764_10G0007390 [Takifugu flavidus]|uniref:Uncharacterized protein n=1 Tax=Takifugu flavidus TaxID=433684 RepID=A0A5C6PLB5_9TELE|nr:hypothetical protein D4764_10G0007390 [Takifugu flavidus]
MRRSLRRGRERHLHASGWNVAEFGKSHVCTWRHSAEGNRPDDRAGLTYTSGTGFIQFQWVPADEEQFPTAIL